ncbi:16S rRNA (guanine(966)-N(2))-methyltransferase RsmD [Acidihalobacter aeolianus]|uniref:Ribosomal RNA small subunit methyltransferase D n=1 Tax=Acidihalobacter aeolianus TaxID=2792603 RepID=A0A1D8KCI5_9GAMM|nr:16S rRNA (guanine(966)-N(2))-methyltransferase RsmD [Acidihalobacter aeolianus]
MRIIGGRWRGRRIEFPDAEGLRPTADRVRETLFNWLQGPLPGARCLDLFAGSGALGLEAASRGAGEVVLVEAAPAVAAALSASVARLGAEHVDVLHIDAQRYLQGNPEPFDIVFLDPPFAQDAQGALLETLSGCGWLAHEAWIYLEYPADRPLPALPGGMELHRHQRAGQAAYALLRWTASDGTDGGAEVDE